MQFDYSEQTWTVGKFTYTSSPSIGAWELALYREKLQQATLESPLGKKLPPANSPKFAKAISAAMETYCTKYPKFAALLACESILTPCEGSPPFEEAVKGLDLVEVSNDLGPLVSFFFESAKSSLPSAPVSPKHGKGTNGTPRGNRSKTTSRRSTANAS